MLSDRSSCSAIRASRNFRAGVCSVAFSRSASVLRLHVQQVVLHVLLGQRRGALHHVTRRRVRHHRPDRALPVHPLMLVEPAVLDRHDRRLHRRRDPVGRHRRPGSGRTGTRSAFPAESVIVDVCGNWPVARSVDTLFTLSLASSDTKPNASAAGNAIPATTIPATRHSPSSRATGRTTRPRRPRTPHPFSQPQENSGRAGRSRVVDHHGLEPEVGPVLQGQPTGPGREGRLVTPILRPGGTMCSAVGAA